MTHRLLAAAPIAAAILLLLLTITQHPHAVYTDFTSPCFWLDYQDMRCLGRRVEDCKQGRRLNTDLCISEVLR